MTTQCVICDGIAGTYPYPLLSIIAIVIVIVVLYFLLRYAYNHSYVTPANTLQMFDSYGEGNR